MLSNRYQYTSNLLRDRYIAGTINYDEYISSLEAARNEELRSIKYTFDKERREAEIFDFEIQQINLVYQIMAKNDKEKQLAQAREEEQEKLKSLTPKLLKSSIRSTRM